jgi:rSAM/selenodomain-associated transferase 1
MQTDTPKSAQPPFGDCTLAIMAKAPRPGMVKTRLAACLPSAAIASLYRCLLEDTLQLAQSLGGVKTAIVSPASDVEELSRLAGGGVSVVAQTGEGLGAGLTSVFAHFLAAGRRRIIAFNSDSPHLEASALLAAFDALADCDLVVGPTHDGGYYLVGATACHPRLFASAALGTTNALDTLLARAASLGLSVRVTDPFYDIDLPADLSRLAGELRFTPGRAPRTARWLAEWAQTAAGTQPGGVDP